MESKNGQREPRIIQRARQARRPDAGLRVVKGRSPRPVARERTEPSQRAREPSTKSTDSDVTRFNALRHGVLSRYTVLPWEDENEHRALLDALVAEHRPHGPTEEHLVTEVAGVLWRKQRLRMAEGAACRRGLKDTPSRETIDAALSHLNFVKRESGDNAKQLADVDQARASITSSLEVLRTAKARSYERALTTLSEEIRERWNQLTRSPRLGLLDLGRPSFSQDAKGLVLFLENQVLPCQEGRRKELENHSLIRDQLLGESFDPNLLEGLARYEIHLDRKLERMLSMLVRLRDLRRPSESTSA